MAIATGTLRSSITHKASSKKVDVGWNSYYIGEIFDSENWYYTKRYHNPYKQKAIHGLSLVDIEQQGQLSIVQSGQLSNV